MRRRRAPSSHVSNKTYSEPNGTEDPRLLVSTAIAWRVSPEEASELRQPRFWIRVFLLLDKLPAKANEPCLPTYTHTHTHTMFNGLFSRTTWVSLHQKGEPFWILLNGLPFWCGFTQVVLEKRPLNVCSAVV